MIKCNNCENIFPNDYVFPIQEDVENKEFHEVCEHCGTDKYLMDIKSDEKQQITLLKSIQDAGFNVVTCYTCPCVFIHLSGDQVIECPDCHESGDISLFPDLWA